MNRPLYDRLCSIPGCEKPHIARGWCRMHYRRWKVNGDPLTVKYERAEEGAALDFLLNTALPFKSEECLEWPYSKHDFGYGQVWIDGKMRRAHRVVCEAENGPPPTPDHEAAHSCGNATCVNPGHLRWATSKENAEDKAKHGTLLHGERAPWAKLTDAQADEIRSLRDRPQREVARMFGVSQPTVSDIQTGRRRAHG